MMVELKVQLTAVPSVEKLAAGMAETMAVMTVAMSVVGRVVE